MSMFGRSGTRVRQRSRRRRSTRLSASSWKSQQLSRASLSGSFHDNREFTRSASTRSRSRPAYPERRSASFHDVHMSRSRSRSIKSRRSFAGRSSNSYNGTVSIQYTNPQSARNSYSGMAIPAFKDTNHLTLGPRNSYSGNPTIPNYDGGSKGIRRSRSQRSARCFVEVEADPCAPDTGHIRRSSSRKSSYSYAGVTHLTSDNAQISRTNSQKSATSYSGYSNAMRQFQRSCSERSTRSRRHDTMLLHPNGTTSNTRHLSWKLKGQGHSAYISKDMLLDDTIWDRTLSRRSRYSLPGEMTGYFKPSPSWVRHARNKSVGSIGLYGSVLCVDLDNSAIDDDIDDVTSVKQCESYLSPHCQCHETELSFDDERQLVRTTVGWNARTGEENQPDYGAFTYQLHEAGKESENVIEFACKSSTIICNTLLVTFLVGLSMTLPITMVSMGVKYLDDCPKEPRVPVYLLVGGCFGMIKLLSTLWRNIQARRYQDIELVFDDSDDSDGAFASTTYRTMDAILFLFLVGWQVAGTYWTLEIWKPLFKQKLHEPRNWCDETVYMFTVYQLVGCYGAMAVYLLVLIFLTCCYRCCNCRRH